MRNIECQTRNNKRKFYSGVTLIELVLAMAMNVIVLLAAGTILVGGNRAWQKTFDSENKQIKEDALAITVAFGSIGRKANRLDYKLYNRDDGTFKPALPVTGEPQETVFGDAVEFRYWDVGLDEKDSQDLLDVAKTSTAYALFYFEGQKLLVDYGPCPPGGIPKDGGSRNTSDVNTQVLAENVSSRDVRGAFSHTTLNGMGQGCVRINVYLTDPDDEDERVNVMTATLMRNIWPR